MMADAVSGAADDLGRSRRLRQLLQLCKRVYRGALIIASCRRRPLRPRRAMRMDLWELAGRWQSRASDLEYWGDKTTADQVRRCVGDLVAVISSRIR